MDGMLISIIVFLVVYSAITLIEDQDIFLIGTNDGLSILSNAGVTLNNIRFWESANPFSAYPNPFLINDYNQIGDGGHVRFVYSNPNDQVSRIDIFDFSAFRKALLAATVLPGRSSLSLLAASLFLILSSFSLAI